MLQIISREMFNNFVKHQECENCAIKDECEQHMKEYDCLSICGAIAEVIKTD